MPVSTSAHISHCVARIVELSPQSVLDVGCGFGLWGFLCREYLDVWNGRVWPKTWQVRIDGIESFEPYIQRHQQALYTSIRIGDIRELAPTLDSYDLIIAGDVIEHLAKAEGREVLDCLYRKAEKALLLNIPLGPGWAHPEAYGNPGELHRSQWEIADFAQYPSESLLVDFPCGPYGVFWCRKDLSLERRVELLLDAAGRCEADNDIEGALRHLEEARRLAPGEELAVLAQADLLLRAGDLQGAVGVLEAVVALKPEFDFARKSLSRLVRVIEKKNEREGSLEQ